MIVIFLVIGLLIALAFGSYALAIIVLAACVFGLLCKLLYLEDRIKFLENHLARGGNSYGEGKY